MFHFSPVPLLQKLNMIYYSPLLLPPSDILVLQINRVSGRSERGEAESHSHTCLIYYLMEGPINQSGEGVVTCWTRTFVSCLGNVKSGASRSGSKSP